jgi:hypothetical protein
MRIPRYIEHVIYTTFYIASLPAVKSFLSPTNTIPGFLAGPAYKKHHGDPRPSDCDITHSTTSLLHMDHMNHTLKYSPISFFHLEQDLLEWIWNNKDNSQIIHMKNSTASPITNLDVISKLHVLTNNTQSSITAYNTSKSLLQSLTASICKVTGKDTYTFGDISTYLDSKAKNAIFIGTKTLGYSFQQSIKGDFPGWIVHEEKKDSNSIHIPESSTSILELSKRLDLNFQEYARKVLPTNSSFPLEISPQRNIQSSILTIQKVSRTIIRKVATGDYQLSDITFLCKVLIALGADFSPVAGLLPVKVLIELFGYSLVIDLGERFMNAIVKELDKRLQWIHDDEDHGVDTVVTLLDNDVSKSFSYYSPGDLTKTAILSFTGKENYQIGDIRDSLIHAVDSPKMTLMEEIGSTTSSTTNDLSGVDTIKELEECLAMERELVQKLNKIGKI